MINAPLTKKVVGVFVRFRAPLQQARREMPAQTAVHNLRG
jgi:hypothetical protein